MASSDVETRVPIVANRAATGVIFGIAMCAYAFRCYVQLVVHKRFPAEDWLLLFSVVILIAATIIYYIQVALLYDALGVILHGFGSSLFGETLKKIPRESKLSNALDTLWWVILFSVKVAYLLFFRKLISRLTYLKRYWWFVVGFLFPAFVICEVVSWQTCPWSNTFKLIAKCSGPEASSRAIKVTATTTVFDILSDVLVASIPVCLLWRVRISTRQKVGLGMTLCLSLVMAVVALIRIAGIRLPEGEVDIVWVSFWEQLECNVAVWMVSMTAFRSFFVTTGQEDGRHHLLSFESIRRRLSHIFHRRSSQRQQQREYGSYGQAPASNGSESSGQPMIQSNEPNIPRGQMTGMQTAIDGAGHSKVLSPMVSHV
ncbi:MAG: hypothetical protein Q9162_007912 [Coniocarpon cinnabarinum]